MNIPTHDELVQQIEKFLLRHKMAETRLGRDVTGEPALVSTIRAGRSPSLNTLNRLASYMADVDAGLGAEGDSGSSGKSDDVAAANKAEAA